MNESAGDENRCVGLKLGNIDIQMYGHIRSAFGCGRGSGGRAEGRDAAVARRPGNRDGVGRKQCVLVVRHKGGPAENVRRRHTKTWELCVPKAPTLRPPPMSPTVE